MGWFVFLLCLRQICSVYVHYTLLGKKEPSLGWYSFKSFWGSQCFSMSLHRDQFWVTGDKIFVDNLTFVIACICLTSLLENSEAGKESSIASVRLWRRWGRKVIRYLCVNLGLWVLYTPLGKYFDQTQHCVVTYDIWLYKHNRSINTIYITYVNI